MPCPASLNPQAPPSSSSFAVRRVDCPVFILPSFSSTLLSFPSPTLLSVLATPICQGVHRDCARACGFVCVPGRACGRRREASTRNQPFLILRCGGMCDRACLPPCPHRRQHAHTLPLQHERVRLYCLPPLFRGISAFLSLPNLLSLTKTLPCCAPPPTLGTSHLPRATPRPMTGGLHALTLRRYATTATRSQPKSCLLLLGPPFPLSRN